MALNKVEKYFKVGQLKLNVIKFALGLEATV